MIHPPFTNVALWIGIAFCIAQTGIFSGLNLALFSVSRLRLEIEAAGVNGDVGRLEATGALNFLDLDDIAVLEEGEPVDPRSITSCDCERMAGVAGVRTHAEQFVPTAT
jgi:hypothetical protein